MKHSVWLEIIVLLFFIIVEIALLNISKNLNELKDINENLKQINYAMVEQNAILKYNPMDEK